MSRPVRLACLGALVVMAVLAAASGVAPGVAAAAGKKSTFVVEVAPAGVSAWQADALAAALRLDLADDRLRLVRDGAVPDLAVRVDLARGELRYVVSGLGAAPSRGVVALASMDRTTLAGELRDVLHRRIRPAHEGVRPGAPAELAAPASTGPGVLALAVLAALLVSPLVLATRLRRGRGALRTLRATSRCLLAAAVTAGAAAALVVAGDRVPELAGAPLFVGGLAWGVVAAALLPLVAPPLPGLHRVEHHELVPVLRTWAALALQRTALVGAAVALALALLGLLGAGLGLPSMVTFGVIAPLVLLALRLVVQATVEVLAARLDDELVDGDATVEQPWHEQVHAYLVGYLRRANLDVDEQVLARLRFLPGADPDAVAVYGGGLGHTRVVIGRGMLEHALAPYGRPHDHLAPRVSTLHWTHWNAGLVMPTEPGARMASREDRRPHQNVDEGDAERVAIGEPATMAGVVEPAGLDPRDHHRPDEDPLWLDWDPGEEHDGTDAGDKDYLFGLLVHAMGVTVRHEDSTRTAALAWERWLAPRRGGRTIERATRALRRLGARQRDALADVAAVLGGARHHLAQYLGWRLWRRDELLTARAYVPQLEQRSRRLVRTLGSEQDGDAATRRRMSRLVPYVAVDVAAAAPRRRWVRAVVVAAAVAAVAAAVVQVVSYRATYHDRIESMKAARERVTDDGKRE